MSNYIDGDEELHDMYAIRPTLYSFPNNLNNEIHEEAFYLQEKDYERVRKRLNLLDFVSHGQFWLMPKKYNFFELFIALSKSSKQPEPETKPMLKIVVAENKTTAFLRKALVT